MAVRKRTGDALTIAHVAGGDVGEDGERCAVGVPSVGARPALTG